MIPQHRENEAYDTLNLARDAPKQVVRERIAVLRVRYSSQSDEERLKACEEAFRTLEQAELSLQAQRDAISARTQTRSERVLDSKLADLSAQVKVVSSKREAEEREDLSKRPKVEVVRDELKNEHDQPRENRVVFDKLNALLKEEVKYLRAMTVLFNMTKSIIEKADFDSETVGLLCGAIDVAATSKCSSGIPLANSSEDHRKASTRIVNLIVATDDLKSACKPELLRVWSHAVLFRNSLFEIDNFNFVRRCKELVGLVSEAKTTPDDSRWLNEVLLSIELLSSKPVSRVIPGRVNDTKTTMTEIFKLTRDLGYPEFFRDRVMEFQKQFMSSLS